MFTEALFWEQPQPSSASSTSCRTPDDALNLPTGQLDGRFDRGVAIDGIKKSSRGLGFEDSHGQFDESLQNINND